MIDPRSHLLFLCVENSCRSQMAEGFARTLGGGRVAAFSAGSRPSGAVDPRAIRFMAERGVDLKGQASKGIDRLPQEIRWDYLVTMGCGDACPQIPARSRLEWDLPDPGEMPDEEFRRVRDRIEALVRDLVSDAMTTPRPPVEE